MALFRAESPDLALIVEAWPALPELIRAGVVALVKASRPRAKAGEDRAPDAS